MANTSLHISLSEQLKADALRRTEEGRYSNPTDYVRQLIRKDVLLAEAKKEFATFIKVGIESPSTNQNPSEMVSALKAELKKGV